ncbi:MAG: putative chaperonin (heat shock protein 33) [Holophagaceae bacterium]|nr:putative chaperonin (heat shock protein 33) [Holophagaceae bacterium]
MTELAPSARVLRALTSDHLIRLAAIDASPLWDGVRRGHPGLEAEACASLVETLTSALLLQSRSFFSERLQILIKGSGRAKALVADSWPEGDIRGILDLSPDVLQGDWLLAPGLLSVMRSNPGGSPYNGNLELVEGPIATQIEAYLQQSEQAQASVTLWCDPATGEAGGLLVEPLPGCPRERLQALVHAIEGLEVVPHWERTPDFLVRWINQGEGAEILASTEVRYQCRCAKDSLVGTLAACSSERIEELFHGLDAVEVHCDYCGKAFQIQRSELGDAAHGQD